MFTVNKETKTSGGVRLMKPGIHENVVATDAGIESNFAFIEYENPDGEVLGFREYFPDNPDNLEPKRTESIAARFLENLKTFHPAMAEKILSGEKELSYGSVKEMYEDFFKLVGESYKNRKLALKIIASFYNGKAKTKIPPYGAFVANMKDIDRLYISKTEKEDAERYADYKPDKPGEPSSAPFTAETSPKEDDDLPF